MRPATTKVRANTTTAMVNAMEVCARFHPNCFSSGATNTLHAYRVPRARFIESPPTTRHQRLMPGCCIICDSTLFWLVAMVASPAVCLAVSVACPSSVVKQLKLHGEFVGGLEGRAVLRHGTQILGGPLQVLSPYVVVGSHTEAANILGGVRRQHEGLRFVFQERLDLGLVYIIRPFQHVIVLVGDGGEFGPAVIVVGLELACHLVTIVDGNIRGNICRKPTIRTLLVKTRIHRQDFLFTQRRAGKEVSLLGGEEVVLYVAGRAQGIVGVGITFAGENTEPV